ncbi:topoisomerase-4 subunit B [Pseudoxanthobacter soli DSM 19599]|uniref:DNA topoisomerase 4 subunit B n=1 Tax=Pseudoxanthobacter soli DSM 19599 TaxID=1123029 RepID=A0A1M7Z6U9_9HYPH|nr:DNA topoisomerase IV subunit B [Pseudoxanthobacter soli]SHO60500.1 topoisomerase-4 subunit B [Pseudoxanthobacter soli DSM 19599]
MNDEDLFAAPAPTPAPRAAEAEPAPARRAERRAAGAEAARQRQAAGEAGYTAADIEVLEGLEPVRRRPGMYIGGTDSKALHHLFAEVIDNSMDEAVAGHATWIEVEVGSDGSLAVTDNGRGIPVDPHPRFPDRSALEVIMTTLHAGGKFDSKVYETSGGLHGVGVSVVNALSVRLDVEVARGRRLYRQSFSRGKAVGPLVEAGEVMNRRGTTVRFLPDPEIFGADAHFQPSRLFAMARSKAYLFAGVEIRWRCALDRIEPAHPVPTEATFRFPGGLADYLGDRLTGIDRVVDTTFAGRTGRSGGHGAVEWAVAFVEDDGFVQSYCNTIPTVDGGTHEQGLRTALIKGIKTHAERTQNKRAANITTEDVGTSIGALLAVFIREPEFVGQTKEKLATVDAARIVEGAVRDAFEHWLVADPQRATALIDRIADKAEDRIRRRQEKEVARRSPTRRLRLPGKLADCTTNAASGTEIFIVEGDSAGGSAKQARNRSNQAILPLRGKILNVASAGRDKLGANQQLSDLITALGCGTRSAYRETDLRYERVILMTDADVDGAHIASLLVTFFYREMPELIRNGHLFLAAPPLYRLTQGARTLYARDDAEREHMIANVFDKRGKVDIGRFKGLGEMLPHQLRETTMDPKTRTLLRVEVDAENPAETVAAVERLMGTSAEARFRFIQEHAQFAHDLDI